MSGAIVQLTNVWKAYDSVQALQGLDLEVLRGEIFGLIGPNGAGKTTAIKIIVGILKMDKGTVMVGGHDITDNPYEYKGIIGYVPEMVSLPDYLTVEEFLTYSGKIRGVPSPVIREQTDFYLKAFELEEKRKTMIFFLSRGMRQKAAMASALIHDPDILILDEPFIGIDPAGQYRVKELFNERVRTGKTIFISTHMLDTAERLCNRVAIIHRGRGIASGDMENLRRLSKTGENTTLEDVFLKLTQEAAQPYPEEPPKKKSFSLFRLGGR